MSNPNDAFEHLFDRYTHFEGLFLMIINYKSKSWQELNSANQFFPKRPLSVSS